MDGSDGETMEREMKITRRQQAFADYLATYDHIEHDIWWLMNEIMADFKDLVEHSRKKQMKCQCGFKFADKKWPNFCPRCRKRR